jgi:hypothetical protein
MCCNQHQVRSGLAFCASVIGYGALSPYSFARWRSSSNCRIVLYSRIFDIGFAHYPKTGGNSLGEWFRIAFPDAAFVLPPDVHNVSHLPVRDSLQSLGLIIAAPAMSYHAALPPLARRSLGRRVRRIGQRLLERPQPVSLAPPLELRCATRVIGVVRDPFETLVSLFEYWRDYPFDPVPDHDFIAIARRGAFNPFLEAAVIEKRLYNYESFFDVGGPAWSNTRLLDFQCIDAGLQAVAEEFDLPRPPCLPHRNRGPHYRRDLAPYARDAGSLMVDVFHHFRWYYNHASSCLVRGR